MLAPPSCGSLTQTASPVSATSDEQHVITSFYSSSGQNEPRMIRTLAGRMRGKAHPIVWRTLLTTVIGRAGEFLLKSRNNRHPCRGWWKATSARHLHLPSLAFCGPSRHRRIQFLHSSSKGKLLRHRLRPLRVCRLRFRRLAFFAHEEGTRRFFAGLVAFGPLASDLLQLSLDPAVGLHTTLFWSGCIFGLLCCFVVGHSRMPIFCGSDP